MSVHGVWLCLAVQSGCREEHGILKDGEKFAMERSAQGIQEKGGPLGVKPGT